MIYFWVVSVEDDFGVFESFWGGFGWSIPWTQLYKLRRTHRRAVVAVLVAVAMSPGQHRIQPYTVPYSLVQPYNKDRV